jgi:hypothetical protein
MPTELLLILVAAAIGTALYWDQFTQRAHVTRLRQAWADHTVSVAPIGTICHGDRPPLHGSRRVFGALALVDDRLTFTGHRDPLHDFAAPVATIRWIGLRSRYKTAWNRRVELPELVVHAETPAGWRVYTFTEGPLARFAEQFGQQTGLPVHEMGEKFEDFGPEPAVYLVQDARGDWQRRTPAWFDPAAPPPDWDGLSHTLYLAPDRLLYDWLNPVPLATIRRVDMLAKGGLNPFSENLLKIETTAEDGEPRVMGFLLPNAGDWAGVIEQRIDTPVIYHAGRPQAIP